MLEKGRLSGWPFLLLWRSAHANREYLEAMEAGTIPPAANRLVLHSLRTLTLLTEACRVSYNKLTS